MCPPPAIFQSSTAPAALQPVERLTVVVLRSRSRVMPVSTGAPAHPSSLAQSATVVATLGYGTFVPSLCVVLPPVNRIVSSASPCTSAMGKGRLGLHLVASFHCAP